MQKHLSCYLALLILGIVCSFFGAGFAAAQSGSSQVAISDTLNNFDDAFMQLKEEREALRGEVESLKSEQRALLEQARKKLEEVEEQKEQYSLSLENAEVKAAALEEEKAKLSDKLLDTEGVVQKVQDNLSLKDSSIEEVKRERGQFKQGLAEAELALQRAAGRIQALQAEKEALAGELETSSLARQKILFGYDDELAAIQKQREALAGDLKTKETGLKLLSEKLARAQKEKDGLRRDYEENLAKINKERQTAVSKAGQMKKEKESLLGTQKEQKLELEKKIKSAQDARRDAEEREKIARHKITLGEEKLKLAESKINNLERKKQELDEKQKQEADLALKTAQEAQDKYRGLQDELARAQEAQSSAQEQKEKLEVRLAAGVQEIGELTARLDSLGAEFKAGQEGLKVTADKLKAAQEKQDAQEKEIQSLKQQKEEDSVHLDDVLKKLAVSEDKLKATQKSAQELTQVKNTLVLTEDKLKITAQEFSTAQAQIESLNSRLEILNQDSAGRQENVEKLNVSLAQLTADNTKLGQSKTGLEKELADLEKELSSLKEEKQRSKIEYETQLSSQEAQIKALRDELAKELEDKKTGLDELSRKLSKNDQEKDSLNEQLEGLKSDLRKAEQNYQEKLSQAGREVVSLKEMESESQAQRQSGQKEVESLRLQLQMLSTDKQNQIESWQAKLKESEDKAGAYESRIAAKQEALQEADKKFALLREEYARAKENLAFLVAENKDSYARDQRKEQAWGKQRQELLEKTDILNTKLVGYYEAMQKSAALEKDNQMLRSGMNNLVQSLNDSEDSLNQVNRAYDEERSGWESLKKEYEADLAQIAEAKNLKTQNQSFKQALKTGETKFKDLLDNFMKLQSDNEQLRQDAKTRINPREYKATKEENARLDKDSRRLKSEVVKLQAALKDLGEKYSLTVKEKSGLEDKTRRMDAHLASWDAEKRQWSRSQEKNKDIVSNKEEKLFALSQELKNTVAENERLKGRIEAFPKGLSGLNAKVEKLEKENALLHYNLGVVYTDKEVYAEAVREFQKTLELKPDDLYSHYNLGIIYSQYLIDEDKAVAHFKKYLKISPNDKDADQARRYVVTKETYAGTPDRK